MELRRRRRTPRESDILYYALPLILSIFLAYNMGASGIAPSFSSAYGAKILRRSLIPLLFGGFVLLGAALAGDKVIRTIGWEMLPDSTMSWRLASAILASCAISLFFANMMKAPQSTSQATVFALAGAGISLGDLNQRKLFMEIVPSWIVLPFICLAITFVAGKLIYRYIEKNGISDFDKISAHPGWKMATIICSCYVAFSIGANNIGNAAGPFISMISSDRGGEISGFAVFACILFVAIWFGIGGGTLGFRVIHSSGRDIVRFGPVTATFVSVITATFLLLASVTRGLPVSLVQLNVAAVIAIGMVKNGSKKTLVATSVPRLFVVWTIAPIMAGTLGFLLTRLLVTA